MGFAMSVSRLRLGSLALLLATSHFAVADIIVEDRPLSSPAPASKPASTPVGVASTPLSAAATSKVVVSEGAAAPADNSGGSNWEAYNQVQQLQQEVEQLRGALEEQSHLIEKLQNDLRTRYTDLDQRLAAQQEQLKQAASSPAPATAAGDSAAAPSATIEEEKKAYLAAYETFRNGGPDKAIPPMLAFVKRYPNSTFTPNAYYWLGEFYLNASTPDQASAQKHFETVLGKYPDHAKAPAALYKLGSIADLQGKTADARKRMQDLLAKYPKSPEAALADSYLKALEAAQAPAKPEARPAAKKPAAKKA
jgi:tol-pal system protein YbgF